MKNPILFPYVTDPAMAFAVQRLRDEGFPIAEKEGPEVTHLFLAAPAFDGSGRLRDGSDLYRLLARFSSGITVVGGMLDHPGLSGYATLDLLKDPEYLARNAAITAHCAIALASSKLPLTLADCPVSVIGGGRIGKCLAKLLSALGAEVTVSVRNAADRAMFRALGLKAEAAPGLETPPERIRLVFNTVPAPVVSVEMRKGYRKDCLMIDLASSPGIPGEDVVWARGLPGKYAPESAGALIAATAARLIKEQEERS